MVTEHLISELTQPLCFHAVIFCRGGASLALVHSIEVVYCNTKLTNKLFQLLSNILVYKNHQVLSVVFKASSTILSMNQGPLVIRIVHGRTSYDVLLLLLDQFKERHENFLSLILFHGMQIDSFAFFLLALIIMQLESVLMVK